MEIKEILSEINKLNFSFFSNDRSRVGKDNDYWKEVEITNVPKDLNLVSAFAEILLKFKILDRYAIKESKIVGSYDSYDAYASSSGRNPLPYDDKKAEEIKDYLKFGCHAIDFGKERKIK